VHSCVFVVNLMLANALLGCCVGARTPARKMLWGHVKADESNSETDLTVDLKKFDIPTLFIHGDDDQIVPIADSALLASKIVKGAKLKVTRAHRTDCAPPTRTW